MKDEFDCQGYEETLKKKNMWKFEAQSSFPLVCNLYTIKIAIK